MQLPTMLALAKSAFTSAQDCHETVLLPTWVYQARDGPSAFLCPVHSQNCLGRDLEITRIRRNSRNDRHRGALQFAKHERARERFSRYEHDPIEQNLPPRPGTESSFEV
jgi:hypothetical protein